MSKEKVYEDFNRAKEFCNFEGELAPRLADVKDVVMAKQSEITDAFYAKLGEDPVAMKIIEGRVDKLKKTHKEWIESLFCGDYGQGYFERRYQIGQRHVDEQVAPYYVEVIMSFLRREMTRAILEADPGNGAGVAAVLAVLDLDLLIINGAYQEDRLARLSEVTGMGRPLLETLMSFSG